MTYGGSMRWRSWKLLIWKKKRSICDYDTAHTWLCFMLTCLILIFRQIKPLEEWEENVTKNLQNAKKRQSSNLSAFRRNMLLLYVQETNINWKSNFLQSYFKTQSSFSNSCSATSWEWMCHISSALFLFLILVFLYEYSNNFSYLFHKPTYRISFSIIYLWTWIQL